MKTFRIIPILGHKTDVLPDDPSMFKSVGEGVALTHAAGGKNYSFKRQINAVTKSLGQAQKSASANAQATRCMGMFELYDGTNRNHLYMDNGKIYVYSSWAPVDITEEYLLFDAQQGTFTAGNAIKGGTSAATATIVSVTDDGSDGTLYLKDIVGTFVDNEVIYESAVGSTLITNGTMEADANWAAYGTPTEGQDLVTFHGGAASWKFTPDAANEGIQSDAFTTTSNLFYLFDAWIYPDDGTTVSIQVRDGANGAYYSYAITGLTENAWNQETFAYQDVDGGAGAFVVFESGAQTSGDFYADDLSVKLITNAALANGAVATTTFAKDSSDLYSIIRVGDWMVFADRAETTPYKWKHGESNVSPLSSAKEYEFRYLTSFQRRVVGLYSGETNGNIDVRWSTAWPATAITSLSFTATNQLYIPNDDPITGVGTLGRDKCFPFCENSIQQLVYYPDYTTPFRIFTVVPDQGSASHHSIVNANGQLFFYNENYGFCSYQGGNTINPVGNDILPDLHGMHTSYLPRIVGKHIPIRKQIMWTVPLDGDTECNHIVIYNYDTGQWEIEEKTTRWIDYWELSDSMTWTELEAAVGGTGIWSDAGSATWAAYLATGKQVVYGKTDGQLYTNTTEQDVDRRFEGKREEPIMSFGNPQRWDTIQEIWFDIGERGNFAIWVMHRSGNTVAELLEDTYVHVGQVSFDNPTDPVMHVNLNARLHQIKWGMGNPNEKFVVNGITLKYVEGSEV